MMTLVFAAVLALLFPSPAPDFPLLSTGDLEGWTVSEASYYNGSQLYGYINGGAEVYREYGFDRVAAQSLENGAHEVQVDIYRMSSARAAYGIYSISQSRCKKQLKTAAWSCVTDYQVQFCKDVFFVNITVMDRAMESRQAAQAAAERVLKKIRGREYALPASLQRVAGSAPPQYIHGPLALAQARADWIPRFEGIRRFDADVFTARDGTTTGAALSFRSQRDAERFLTQAGWEASPGRGKWRSGPREGGAHFTAVFVENSKRLRFVEGRSKAAVEAVTVRWKN